MRMVCKRKAGGVEKGEVDNGGSKVQKVTSTTSSQISQVTCSTNHSKACRVKVYVRIRPFKPSENEQNCVIQVVEDEPCTSLVFDPKEEADTFYFKGEVQSMRDINKKVKKNQTFEFDQVFSSQTDNETVFQATSKAVISSILDGYNCSVFAYGATGAGKTYTMLGKEDSPGISYLTIQELLKHIDSNEDKLKISMVASYIEVYNEEVRDLLKASCSGGGGRGCKLELRDVGSGGTCISGLRVVNITSAEQLFSLLEDGNRQRTQHPTDSNSESSRSHAVFQVGIRMQEKNSDKVRLAKLTMIDLAGSERGCATGYKGNQFKEGRAINQSLLALGNCINALANGQKYVPYRDSKLTRILKDSLGGNCRTLMIANISPSNLSYEETYNTLKYAMRARSILTTSNQNFASSQLSVGQYKHQNNELRIRLSKLESEIGEAVQWCQEMKSCMGEKLKLYSELMALESQSKITEWRVSNSLSLQALIHPKNQTQKGQESMDKWRNRLNVLKTRIAELEPSIGENKASEEKLLAKMNKVVKMGEHQPTNTSSLHNQFIRDTYLTTTDYWNTKVEQALQEIESAHSGTMVKLMGKSVESLSMIRDQGLPTLLSYYHLLQQYGHVSSFMEQSHEELMKKMESLKYVSWEQAWSDEKDGDEKNPALSHYYRLTRPDSASYRTSVSSSNHNRSVVPAGGGLPRIRHTTPFKGGKTLLSQPSPLRTLQPTSKTIYRSNKTPTKLKISKSITATLSSLSKENIVKEPMAKTLNNKTPTKLKISKNITSTLSSLSKENIVREPNSKKSLSAETNNRRFGEKRSLSSHR